MEQLDLFRYVPAPAETPPSEDARWLVIGSNSIEDEELLDAIDHPRALRIAAEIGVPSSNG